jgi:hypothetical protein
MTMAALPDSVRRAVDWHRPMMVFAGFMAVMTVVSLGGIVFDDRVLGGSLIWTKPFKFALSIGVYCVTWAWMQSLLPRGRKAAWWISTVLTALLTVEYVLLTVQVIRGKWSHFNKATPLDDGLGRIMGLSAAAIMVGTFVLTLVFFFIKVKDPAIKWAIRTSGLISIAGMMFGPPMGAATEAQKAAKANGTFDGISGGHSVGVADGGPSIPLLGWSTVGGDLRIPHLVGLHALQALPLLVLVLVVLSSRFPLLGDAKVRARLVLVGAAGYAGLTALVGWQALRGQSLVRPDGLTLMAFGALVAFVALASAAVLGLAKPAPVEPERTRVSL